MRGKEGGEVVNDANVLGDLGLPTPLKKRNKTM